MVSKLNTESGSSTYEILSKFQKRIKLTLCVFEIFNDLNISNKTLSSICSAGLQLRVIDSLDCTNI